MKKYFASDTKRAWRSLRLVMFESAITAGLLSMSVMTPFFLSLGLDQAKIAVVQAVFTVVLMIVNVPAGWLADRFGRKWANVIGDFGHALVLLGYATAQNLWQVLLYEILAGIFLSISKGVDMSLLRHFSRKISKDGEFFGRKAADLAVLQHLCALILVLLGGPIGTIDFRLAIAVSSIPYFLAGFAAFFIEDDSEKLVSKCKTPLEDIWRIAKKSLANPALRLRILTYAVGRQMTHGIIWVFTPMLIYVGVPLSIVSCAWALNSMMCIIGARIASKVAGKLSDRQNLLVPLVLMLVSMGAITVSLNVVTVWCYLLMGLVQGWTSATFSPMVQRYAGSVEQTTVLSLNDVVSNLLYVPTVWLIGRAADFELRYAALATAVIFGILGVALAIKLSRE